MTQRDPEPASEWLDVVMEEVRRKREEAAERQPDPKPRDVAPDAGGRTRPVR